MSLFDQHVHSRHSVDCQADPAEAVGRAIACGLAGLTFCEHYDSHPDERDVCIYDYERITETLDHLRAEYGQRIFIGRGIEVCYQPATMDEILRHVEGHAFDLAMLSVHWFDGRALHERRHWAGVDAATATRSYLYAVLEAARFARDLARAGRRPFDALAHLDLVKRYTQRYFGAYDVRSQEETVEQILRACLEADLVLELNTSTLRQSLPEPMPAEWALRRYAELGGRAVVLGSDAHAASDVGAGLAEAVECLKRAGIRCQAVFEGRQRRDIPLW